MEARPYEELLRIDSDEAVVAARQRARALALDWGYPTRDALLLATAVSELGRNILAYAGHGEIVLQKLMDRGQAEMMVTARDEGPGIRDVDMALQEGFSTSGGSGLGLPGTKRVMDEFHIATRPGKGTTVTIRKYRVREPAPVAIKPANPIVELARRR